MSTYTLREFREQCPQCMALFSSYSSMTQAVHRYGISHRGSGNASHIGYPVGEWRTVIAMRLMTKAFAELSGAITASQAIGGMRPSIAWCVRDSMPTLVDVNHGPLLVRLAIPINIVTELNRLGRTTTKET